MTMNQHTFLKSISQYFNTGCLTRFDKLLSLVKPTLVLKRNASIIKNNFLTFKQNEIQSSQTFEIPHYTGSDKTALQIGSYLRKNLSAELSDAFVHGSIATDEKIAYSDFDGLVIIKNKVFESADSIAHVAEHLSKSYSIMIKGDALQHHGWFIVTEKELSDWPSHYFPPEILNHSRSILNGKTMLNLHYTYNVVESKSSLVKMVAGIERTLSNGNFPDNAYQLKSLFSEFMLLPALFLQARSEKGVYKKYSFTEAKKYVSSDLWKIMDQVSAFRQNWNLNSGLVLPDEPVLVTPSVKKKQIEESMLMPEEIQVKLTKQLREEMLQLSRFFVNNIQ